MEAIKVLIIDDDIALGQVITLALNENGYEAHYQSSLIAVIPTISELKPHIIILDVEIGNKNGIDTAPELMEAAPEIPIIFISSHVESTNVIKALNAGGMMYLKKPFEIEELLAYIKRFTNKPQSKWNKIGNLELEDTLLRNGNEIIKRLTLFEYKLLILLSSRPNQIVTREDIESELWDGKIGSGQSMNNFITKLRRYLASDKSLELVTIPKIGYKLMIK